MSIASKTVKSVKFGYTTTTRCFSACSKSLNSIPSESTNANINVQPESAPIVTRRGKATNFSDALNKGPSFDDFVSGRAKDMLIDPLEAARKDPNARLPKWLKVPIPKGQSFHKVKKDVKELKLATVCEEAKCPNIGECWGGKKSEATATIMLMGDTCTRGCRFCSVKTDRKPAALDPNEPANTAEAISRWELGYVVLTTVDRDDLPDGGAAHLSETVKQIKEKAPKTLIEVLSGDFRGELEHVQTLAKSPLDVFAHNVETVEALTPHVRDRRATYRQSLSVLENAKLHNDHILTKTSIMLGFGETDEQVLQTLKDLRAIGVDVVTFGQYMRPTKRHMKVVEYVKPEKFDYWKDVALDLGFLYCASGPLVRSSYKAGEAYIENVIRKRKRNVGISRDVEVGDEKFVSKAILEEAKV
jgi:lipoyl synthase